MIIFSGTMTANDLSRLVVSKIIYPVKDGKWSGTCRGLANSLT